MPTTKVELRKVSVVSSRPFDVIVQRLTANIGLVVRLDSPSLVTSQYETGKRQVGERQP
jgi:hypothetical protein